MRPAQNLVLTSALLAVVVAPTFGSVLYVDPLAGPGGSGGSWGSAYRHLQDALASAAAPGSPVAEIRIAQGIQRPDEDADHPNGSGEVGASFLLRSGLALRGGYAGLGSATPDARDPALYPTILSGDLDGDDQPNWVNHWNNTTSIVVASGVDATAVLDGVIVRGGYGPSSSGAGLRALNGSPTVIGCVFEECLAASGGALLSDNGSPTIVDCTFQGNYAWGGRGGALYFGSPGAPAVTGCTLASNTTYGAGGPGDGGAAFVEASCPATFSHCDFLGNSVTTSSLAMYPTGGAITSLADGLTCDGCRFLHNASPLGAGGAIWAAGDGSRFLSCEFTGNSSKVGGAIHLFFAADVAIVNCTAVGNTAGDGGGLSMTYSSSATIANCILWSNTANAPTTYKANIHKDDSSEASISFTCIESMWVPERGEDPLDPANFPGCTDANPLFVDANGPDNLYGTLDDDVRLAAASPLVDAGTNLLLPADSALDAGGLPRRMDDPLAVDSGEGQAPIVDFGSRERGDPPMPGDLDGDGDVDAADLAILLGAWGSSDAAADLDGSGAVDAADLALLLGAWG